MTNLAINGFGRIGRMIVRASLKNPFKGNVVAINNPNLSVDYLIYLLKYDSMYGRLENVKLEKIDNDLLINGRRIRVSQEQKLEELKWNEENIDVVFECSGKFLSEELSEGHLKAGAKKVIISDATNDSTKMFVYGVNHHEYERSYKIISSCTPATNCLAPIAKILNDAWEIKEGSVTIIHSFNINPNITEDIPNDRAKWRLGRSSLSNIIPNATEAVTCLENVIPNLKGKIIASSFIVPTTSVSCISLSVKLGKQTSLQEIQQKVKEQSEGKMKGILGYTDSEAVSMDFRSDHHSSIVDIKGSSCLNPTFVNIVAWFDNDLAYIHRLIDMAAYIMKTEKEF